MIFWIGTIKQKITFFYKSLGREQSIYINGKNLATKIQASEKGNSFVLDRSMLKAGKNNITILATPLLKKNSWDVINSDPGAIQVYTPAARWKRKLFSGLAQVIIQKTPGKGEVILKANGEGLKSTDLKLESK